jgi:serine/threonine protein kinase
VNHLKNIHPGIPFAPFVSRSRFEVEPKFDKECKDCNYCFKGPEDWINHLAEKAIARDSKPQTVSRRNKTLLQSHEDSVSEYKERECLENTLSIPNPLGSIAPEESPENGPCSFTRSRPILNHKSTPHEPLVSAKKTEAWKTSQKGQEASPFPIFRGNEMANQRHFLTAPAEMSNKHPIKEDLAGDTKGIMDSLRNIVPAWKKWPVPYIMKKIKDRISIIPVPSRKSTQHNKIKVVSSFRISKLKHKPMTRHIQFSREIVSTFHPEDIEDSRDDCLKRDTQPTLKDCLLEARISKDDNQFYIPVDAISKLISHEAIIKELRAIYPEDSPEAYKDLAFKIFGGRQKLFGILAIIGKLSTTKDLLAENLCDQDLPLRLPNSSTAGTNATLHKIESTTGRSLQVFSPWTAWELDEFRRVQWSFLAPVFGSGISHYNFERNVILPFQVTDDQFHQGGFSTVFSARVHPAHQVWENIYAEDSKKGPMIAVKQLFSADEQEFEKEKSILQKLSKQDHPHIIKLLATYQHKNLYNLIFPLANSNLRQYWADAKHPKFSSQTALWVLKQCEGMAEGLAAIHNFTVSDQLMSPRPLMHHEGNFSVSQGEKIYCSHMDLKPENILRFESPGGNGTNNLGVFKISDFGLARFHGRESRSKMDAKEVGFTPTYAAPELALGKPISRKYDLWSLGCLYLEFITWLLQGGAEVEAFADARTESNPIGIQDDCFYSIRPPEEGKERSAIVRVGVARWIARLRKSPRCSGLLKDFLHLIETELLVVDPHQRIRTTDLVRRFQAIMDKANTDPNYLVQPDTNLGDGVGVQIEKRPRSNSQSSCDSHMEVIKRRRVCEEE